MSTIQETDNELEKLWSRLRREPKLVVTEVSNLLLNIRKLRFGKGSPSSVESILLVEMRALHLLAHAHLRSGNLNSAAEVATELHQQGVEYSSKEYISLADQVFAKLELEKGNYQTALQTLRKAIPALEAVSNHEYVAALRLDISRALHLQNLYAEEIEVLVDLEKYCREHLAGTLVHTIIYANLADTYRLTGRLDRALYFAQRAAATYKQMGDNVAYARSLLSIGSIHSERSEFKKQISVLKQALSLFAEVGAETEQLRAELALGGALFDDGQIEDAAGYLTVLVDRLKKRDDNANLAIAYLRLAHLFAHLKYPRHSAAKANSYFSKANLLAQELKLDHMQSSILNNWAEFKKDAGIFDEAFELLKRSYDLEKSILNEQSVKHIQEMEIRYEVALKDWENEVLQLQSKASQMEIEHLKFQLSSKAQAMLQQKKSLNAFKQEILSITHQLDKAENIVRKVKMQLKSSPVMRSDWDSFIEVFSSVHRDFQQHLLTKFPSLTRMEVKICTLIKSGLKTEEITELLSLSERTIENHRLRIRKKLKLRRGDNIYGVLELV